MRFLVNALFTVAVAGTAGAQEVQGHVSELRMATSATTTVAPDYAVLRIAVTSQDERAARAAQANARVVAAINDTLRVLGIRPDSVSTGSYAVQAAIRDREGRVRGYAARAELHVVLRDLARIGELIDAMLAAGATEVAPSHFGATSISAARDSAYAEAVRDLYQRARVAAAAAGGELVGPVQLAVNESRGRVACAVCLQEYRPPDPTTQVTPGLIAITVNATGTFRFQSN